MKAVLFVVIYRYGLMIERTKEKDKNKVVSNKNLPIIRPH